MDKAPVIVAVVSQGESRLAASLHVALGELFSTACCTPEFFSLPGRAPQYLICACAPGCALSAPAPIVVLSDRLDCPPGLVLPQGAALVWDASCAPAASFSSRFPGMALGCGLGLSDALSLSSITEKSAMVSLRVPVRGIGGEEILPFELPVALSRPVKPYALLACAAVMILSGQTQLLGQIAF